MQFLEDSSRRFTMAVDGNLPVEPMSPYERLRKLATGNAVVIFTISGCCMCHVVKRLLLGLGVGPTVYELDKLKGGRELQSVLHQLVSGNGHQQQQQMPVPAVFVGGKLVGGLDNVMSCHINGLLVPLLKEAGALWL